MADLDYKIKTTAEGDGLKQTTAEADKLKESTKELKEQKKGLIDQLKLLRHELPGVGEAIHLIRNPAVLLAAGIGVVISAIRSLKEQMEELDKSVAPFENLSASFGNFRDIIEDTKLKIEDLALAERKLAKESNTAETRYQARLKEIEQEAKLAEQLTEALIEQAKAQIELNQAKGGSSVEATLAKARLEEQAAAMKRGAGLSRGAAEMGALTRVIADTQHEISDVGEQIPGGRGAREAAARSAASRKRAAEVSIDFDNTEIENQKKIAKEHQEAADFGKKMAIPPEVRIAEEEAKAQDARNRVKELTQDRITAQALLKRAEHDLQVATEAEADLVKRKLELEKALIKLLEEKVAKERSLQREFDTNKQLASIEGGTRSAKTEAELLKEGKEAEALRNSTGRQMFERVKSGQGYQDLVPTLNSANQALIDLAPALEQWADQHNATVDRLLKLVHDLLRNQKATNNRIDNLQN